MLFGTGAYWATAGGRCGAVRYRRGRAAIYHPGQDGEWDHIAGSDHPTRVGSITMHDIPAAVTQPGALHDNLLGQTYLARLRDRVMLHAH
jgi:hypothetical protein